MEFLVEKILVDELNSFRITERDLGDHTAHVHSHQNHELNYISSGWGHRFVGDSIFDFREGDLVLIGPNLPHCWRIEGTHTNSSPKCIVIHFHETFMGSHLLQAPELAAVRGLLAHAAEGIFFRGPEVQTVQHLMQSMLQQTGLPGFISLLQIFSVLVTVQEFSYLSSPGYMGLSQRQDFEKINRVYEFVFHQFQEPIKLEQVATLVNLTPAAFCRYFKQKTKKTFSDYLKQVRIGFACKRLIETGDNISKICYESGYNNLAHFNQQFKQLKGMTPRDYRRMLD